VSSKLIFPYVRNLDIHIHVILFLGPHLLLYTAVKKTSLFKVYKRTSLTTNKSSYISYRNKLKSVLVAAERSYYSAQFAMTSASMKDTWQFISKIINVPPKASLPPSFATCTGDVSDPIIIANEFND